MSKRNLRILKPIAELAKFKIAVECFSVIHARNAKRVKYFNPSQKKEARQFAQKNGGILTTKIIKK